MSKLTEAYREVGVCNPDGFAGHDNVFIVYTPEEPGRAYRPSKWRVCRAGFKTDPTAHWMDYGNKSFHLYGHSGVHKERKSAAFEMAKEWASERYGIKEWARTPFGSWMDAEFVKARMAELKAQMKSNDLGMQGVE